MLIMAVDPGRDKTGIAIVDDNKKVYFKDIVFTGDVISLLGELSKKYKIDLIILGNGTYSEEIKLKVKEKIKLPLEIVDEKNSTIEAEEKYRKEKQNWLFRIIRWKPSRPLDDYSAVVLVERYLDSK